METLQILHLEDDPLDSELIAAHLEEGGIACHLSRVSTQADFLSALDENGFDLVLADYSLPMFDGLSALKMVRERGEEIPFILLSGALGEDLAIESLKSGATDYVLKQRMERLAPAVRRALREAEARAQKQQAEETLRLRQEEIESLNVRLQRAVAESHHRIKNNLQVLAALVDMQILNAQQMVPVGELERISQHIRTLASLHDMLTQESRDASEHLDVISLRNALARLVEMLQMTAGEVRIQMEAEDVSVNLKQGSAFILIVNELVSNAVKHGASQVEILLKLLPENTSAAGSPKAQLSVCDNGPGFPEDFDPEQAANTGLELVQMMGRWDLNAELSFTNLPSAGACVRLNFPLQSNGPASTK